MGDKKPSPTHLGTQHRTPLFEDCELVTGGCPDITATRTATCIAQVLNKGDTVLISGLGNQSRLNGKYGEILGGPIDTRK